MKLTDRYRIGLLLIVVLGCGEDAAAPMPPSIDPVMPVPAGIRVTPSELVSRTLGQTACIRRRAALAGAIARTGCLPPLCRSGTVLGHSPGASSERARSIPYRRVRG